ncbi:MAG: hypothetical protein ACQETJ_09405 [Bacteroidota bacterium]
MLNRKNFVESGIEKFEFHKYCDDYSWYEFETLEIVKGKIAKKSIDEFIAGLNKGKLNIL